MRPGSAPGCTTNVDFELPGGAAHHHVDPGPRLGIPHGAVAWQAGPPLRLRSPEVAHPGRELVLTDRLPWRGSEQVERYHPAFRARFEVTASLWVQSVAEPARCEPDARLAPPHREPHRPVGRHLLRHEEQRHPLEQLDHRLPGARIGQGSGRVLRDRGRCKKTHTDPEKRRQPTRGPRALHGVPPV